jgi:hypothetical protein
MHTLLRIANILLIIGMIACCAGALAGLIVLLPFVAGAWVLNLLALVGFDEAARTGQSDVARKAPRTETRERVAESKPDAVGLGDSVFSG